jgi:hypothetical protein
VISTVIFFVWVDGAACSPHTDLCRISRLSPVTTGWLVREVYLGPYGRQARRKVPERKLEHWMYKEVRRACETYAVRIARGIERGSPILWKLKEGNARYAVVIRKRKAAAYARRKRRLEQA